MAEDPPRPRKLSRARLIGRRVGQVVYVSAVGAFAFTATWQITKQVFFPDAEAVTAGAVAAPQTCHQGLSTLYEGIERAKKAAEDQSADEHMEAPLNRFRLSISHSWAHREKVGGLCGDPEEKRLLDALDRLRYSEEHGVRKQAAELTALRKRVSKMAAEVLEDAEPNELGGIEP